MHGAFSHLFLQILIESGLSLELQMLLWLDMITQQQNLAFLGSTKSEITNFFDIMMYIIISDSTCYDIIFC